MAQQEKDNIYKYQRGVKLPGTAHRDPFFCAECALSSHHEPPRECKIPWSYGSQSTSSLWGLLQATGHFAKARLHD